MNAGSREGRCRMNAGGRPEMNTEDAGQAGGKPEMEVQYYEQ